MGLFEASCGLCYGTLYTSTWDPYGPPECLYCINCKILIHSEHSQMLFKLGYIHNTRGGYSVCPSCILQSIVKSDTSRKPTSPLFLKDYSNTLDRFELLFSSERFFQLIQCLEPILDRHQKHIEEIQEMIKEAKRDGCRFIDDTNHALQSLSLQCAQWIWSFGLTLFEFVQLCKRYFGSVFVSQSKLDNITGEQVCCLQ